VSALLVDMGYLLGGVLRLGIHCRATVFANQMAMAAVVVHVACNRVGRDHFLAKATRDDRLQHAVNVSTFMEH